ncbi:MAG TPA: hypothetical protein VH370_06880 [Humisphaera sp.]|jgi:hypothetical protein|nr:hypothetical protein [Humisphaera sp.]
MAIDVDLLLDLLRGLGVKADLFSPQSDPQLFYDNALLVATVSGGPLDDMSALLKANGDVCKISTWQIVPAHGSVESRLKVAEKMLRLNFEVPFGRVSMASYQRSANEPERIDLFFAETMFFWQCAVNCKELLSEEVRRRLAGLVQLSELVKVALDKGALDKTD